MIAMPHGNSHKAATGQMHSHDLIENWSLERPLYLGRQTYSAQVTLGVNGNKTTQGSVQPEQHRKIRRSDILGNRPGRDVVNAGLCDFAHRRQRDVA